jgi:hypothetical protein
MAHTLCKDLKLLKQLAFICRHYHEINQLPDTIKSNQITHKKTCIHHKSSVHNAIGQCISIINNSMGANFHHHNNTPYLISISSYSAVEFPKRIV